MCDAASRQERRGLSDIERSSSPNKPECVEQDPSLGRKIGFLFHPVGLYVTGT